MSARHDGAVGDARKRHAVTQTSASQPVPAPVDSGSIGRLNEAERDALMEAASCDYDPREGDPLFPAVERIVRERTDRALAEALGDIRARRQEFNRLGAHEQYLMALDDAFGLVNNRLAIVRAARQEQGR